MSEQRLIHFEIVGRDAPALQRFYGDLFGWQFNTDNPGGYAMTSDHDTGVVVGIGSSPDGTSGHVTGYITVADVDAALAKASGLGGRVVMPKFSPSEGVTLGLLADPEGHVIGITQA